MGEDLMPGPNPFDSYHGRLDKSLDDAKKKTEEAQAAAEQQPPDPFDSYAGRLDAAMKGESSETAEQAAPGSTDQAAPAEAGAPALGDENVLIETMPEGYIKHVVRKGECMNKLAEQYGFAWDTLWNDPHNGRLQQVRQDPNVLLVGDEVAIPEKRRKEEPGETERLHRFRRKGQPARLVLQFMDDDEPKANAPYKLQIDGKWQQGTTDADGKIDIPLPNDAKRGLLQLEFEGRTESYRLKLSGLDPFNTISGAQARLKNLGYDVGDVDGELDGPTRAAIREFQAANELAETGELDEATCQKLKEQHGS